MKRKLSKPTEIKMTYHQGDINFIPLTAFKKVGFEISRDKQLRANKNRLLIQEGEITGHHHGVWFLPKPAMFRDDALARDVAENSETIVTAKLYQDDALVSQLQKHGLDVNAPVVGFLIAETDVTIKHASENGTPTMEHSDINLPAGSYLVTRKREWTAGDQRRVQD